MPWRARAGSTWSPCISRPRLPAGRSPEAAGILRHHDVDVRQIVRLVTVDGVAEALRPSVGVQVMTARSITALEAASSASYAARRRAAAIGGCWNATRRSRRTPAPHLPYPRPAWPGPPPYSIRYSESCFLSLTVPAPAGRGRAATSDQVKTIQAHNLGPCRHEILDEFLLGVDTGVHLRDGTQL